MAAPLVKIKDELTRDGTGETMGLPAVLATFQVAVKFTGVVTVARICKNVSQSS